MFSSYPPPPETVPPELGLVYNVNIYVGGGGGTTVTVPAVYGPTEENVTLPPSAPGMISKLMLYGCA